MAPSRSLADENSSTNKNSGCSRSLEKIMLEGGGIKQQYRDGLIKLINDNVKICQEKFGGRTLLATESEAAVVKVINGIELILQDGLKAKSLVNLKNISLNVNHFSLRYNIQS